MVVSLSHDDAFLINGDGIADLYSYRLIDHQGIQIEKVTPGGP